MAWMFRWFWYFVFYSLCGFGCEVLFSRLTGGRRDRKGMLLLPLCPVYGLGACAILLLPPVVRAHTMPLFFLGGLAAAAVFRLLAGDLNFTPGYTTRAEGQSYATMIAFAFCSLIFGIVCLILALITPFRRESHPFTRVLRRYCPVTAT